MASPALGSHDPSAEWLPTATSESPRLVLQLTERVIAHGWLSTGLGNDDKAAAPPAEETGCWSWPGRAKAPS